MASATCLPFYTVDTVLNCVACIDGHVVYDLVLCICFDVLWQWTYFEISLNLNCKWNDDGNSNNNISDNNNEHVNTDDNGHIPALSSILCDVKRINYNGVIMGAMVSQITSLTIVYSIVYPWSDQRKHQSSALLAFVRWIHRWPVNSPHKWPVTRKMFQCDDAIM